MKPARLTPRQRRAVVAATATALRGRDVEGLLQALDGVADLTSRIRPLEARAGVHAMLGLAREYLKILLFADDRASCWQELGELLEYINAATHEGMPHPSQHELGACIWHLLREEPAEAASYFVEAATAIYPAEREAAGWLAGVDVARTLEAMPVARERRRVQPIARAAA